MIVHEVIKRLRGIDRPVFKDRVAGSIDYFTARTGNMLKAPFIYVIEGAGQAVGSPVFSGDEIPEQLEWRNTFMVIAVCKPPSADEDMSMKWATDVVRPVRDIIWGALNGYEIEGYYPIIPVSVVPGEGAKNQDGEYLQIVFTFTANETVCFDDSVNEADEIGALSRFGIVMNGASALIDPCKESDCEIPPIAGC